VDRQARGHAARRTTTAHRGTARTDRRAFGRRGHERDRRRLPRASREARAADYERQAVFTRPDTLGLIELARQIVATVEAVETDESSLLFGLIAMQARVQAR